MQTFVPHPDWEDCAECLDRKRLGKQRVECLQIARSLLGISAGWRNHPATRMWEKNLDALMCYAIVICDEWVLRGYDDSCLDQLLAMADAHDMGHVRTFMVKYYEGVPAMEAAKLAGVAMPSWWLGPIHESHRRSLLFKLPEWYAERFPGDRAYLPTDKLFWPVQLRSEAA